MRHEFWADTTLWGAGEPGMNVAISSDAMSTPPQFNQPDILCLSHLRWSFVFQRPQHLMSRYAKTQRVFYVEEPIVDGVEQPCLSVEAHDGVFVVVPRMP